MKKEKLYIIAGFLIVGIFIIAAIFSLLKTQRPVIKKLTLEKELNIFNWESYLSEEVIEDFEKRYNVDINLETFEDSTIILQTIQSTPDKYDLIVIADDQVQEMKTLKLLARLEHQKIPNIKNLKEEARENYYDTNNLYCIPYVHGYTGIIVNTKYIQDYDSTRNILWDERYQGKITMPNNSFEILMNALFFLGADLDHPTQEQLEEAKRIALDQQELVIGYNDPIEQRELMMNEDAWIAYIYSTEYLPLLTISENTAFKFFAPKEGVTLWADNFCIPKDAPHKNAAQAFLNYLLEPEVSAKNSQDLKVLMVNQAMEKFLAPEFLANTKGTDFPLEKETLLKSTYGSTLGEEIQVVANQLWSELGIPEE